MSVVTNAAIARAIALIDADITHLGIGTGASPASGDSVLASELLRKSVSTIIDGNTIIKEGFWDESEANGNIYTNTGVFCNGATNAVGTGTLFSGGDINITKDNTQSLTVSIEITVEAVNT